MLRLYTKASFEGRPEQERPEVQRLDLAGPLLSLYGAGLAPESNSSLDIGVEAPAVDDPVVRAPALRMDAPQPPG